MSVTQAIIADAGFSSRFLPIVKTVPKSMLPLGSKPVMQVLVEECLEAGIDEITIICRKDSIDTYKDYFENRRDDLCKFLEEMGKPERFDSVKKILGFPKLNFILQDAGLPYGTAAPVISAKPYLKPGEPFVFIQGDDVVFAEKRDCQILVEEYEKDPSYAGYMMVQEHIFEGVSAIGMVKMKDNSDVELLDYIVEKPHRDVTPSFLGSYGRFLYNYKIFDYMDPKRIGQGGELWNVDALTAMAKEHPVKIVRNQGTWMTTGDPLNYLKAQIMNGMRDEKMRETLKEFIMNSL